MLRADLRLRRQTLVAMGISLVLAVFAIILFQQWLNSVGSMPGTDLLILRLRRTIGLALTGSAICLALLAWYSVNRASRARLADQWPLPDTRVIRDTPIRRGVAAQKIANRLQAAAIILLVLAFAAGYVSWQMLSAN